MVEQSEQVAKRGLTNEDLWRFKNVTDARLSPDGTRVAYTVGWMTEEDDSLHSAIWLVDIATGSTRQLTNGEAADSQPAWAPDGSRLAFISTRDGKPQVYILDLGGGDPRKLTNEERGASSPAWSPDGKRLVYMGDVARDSHLLPSETAWLEAHPKAAEKGGPKLRHISALKYRFDMRGYIEGNGHLFLVDAEGGEPRQLTDGPQDDAQPVWSPDGTEIAFLSDRTEDAETHWSTGVWSVNVESGEARRLTSDHLGPFTHGLSWSPDGSMLAYFSAPDITRGPYGDPHLWLVSRTGGDERDLSAPLDRPSLSAVGTDFAFGAMTPAAWSPDGTTLYFPVSDHGNQHLYAIEAQSGAARRVTEGDVACGGPQITPDGQTLVFLATAPTRPLDVCTVSAGGGTVTPLTQANQELLEGVRLSTPESFTFRGPGDWEIQGWLVKPLDIGPGERYPLVLHIHGGPWGAYGNGFYLQKQTLATAGIASLYINPRGSTGYGQAFASANDWGLDDFGDLMAGVDAVLARGEVDPDRLGVTGISYGGYMTNWVIGHTSRFACAVSENGICNLVSFFGTADVGAIWFQRELGGPFWQSRDMLERFIFHSPISYIDRVTTPLLLVQGEADFRCPIEQGEQMLAALRMQGQTAEMIRFPNASHGIVLSAAPHHRIEHWDVAERWYRRYLLPPVEEEAPAEAATPQVEAIAVPTQ
jgi:dipeptidyl aminopeptidase/acylaminoacyl peptidase